MFYTQLGNSRDRYRFDTAAEARAYAVDAISKKRCLYAYIFTSETALVEDAGIVREDGKYLCYQYNKKRESTIYTVRKDGELVR